MTIFIVAHLYETEGYGRQTSVEARPMFNIGYFTDRDLAQEAIDTLQSEQLARFHADLKRWENIETLINEENAAMLKMLMDARLDSIITPVYKQKPAKPSQHNYVYEYTILEVEAAP